MSATLEQTEMVASLLAEHGLRAEVREPGSVRVSLEARRVTLAEVEEILDGEHAPWCRCITAGGAVFVDVEGPV